MKSINSIIFLLLGLIGSVFSQTGKIQLSITPTFGVNALHVTDAGFQTNDSSILQITELKFYISKIQFLKNGKVVIEEMNSFHLVDAANEKPFSVSIDNKQNIPFDELRINLGIDSATNVSGAMGGDLDPTKGMYWTWQSGFINFKLEGKCNVCQTRNKEFTFHLGGYQQPFYALQMLSFPLKNTNQINLIVDAKKILHQIDLEKINQIMSPSHEAVLLSKVVADAITVSEK